MLEKIGPASEQPLPRPGPSSPRKPTHWRRPRPRRSQRPAATLWPVGRGGARRLTRPEADRAAAAGRARRRKAGRRSGPSGPARSCASAKAAEGGVVELGGGLRRAPSTGTCDSAQAPAGPRETTLPLPGSCRSAAGSCAPSSSGAARARPGPRPPRSTRQARRRAQGPRAGARATACGPSGSADQEPPGPVSDAKVPRSLRPRCPWSSPSERIAWVAGVAVSEEFKLGDARPTAARPDHGPRDVDCAP